ncbi:MULTISPECIES: hypothetical protein [unclassified Aurantimonas]|uniref:hypothetical protein n=1 Tax=unclassified Aurantimonas TaxID=2638230 RepID=UPI002E175729|nr:hypothetical protein [Aurantimonas sp. A3-2-R12]
MFSISSFRSNEATRFRATAWGVGAAVLLAVAFVPVGAAAQSDEEMIVDALRAAPPGISETATVSDLAGKVLRKGSGGYTCFPAPTGIAGPMCMDAEWLTWMDAWMNQKPFTAKSVGVAYMMAGDSPEGGASNIDPAAATPTSQNEWVVEGPHIMVISPDPADLEGLPVTMETDGPYVMWSGTPYAHVMIPVGARPDQRKVAQK